MREAIRIDIGWSKPDESFYQIDHVVYEGDHNSAKDFFGYITIQIREQGMRVRHGAPYKYSDIDLADTKAWAHLITAIQQAISTYRLANVTPQFALEKPLFEKEGGPE